MIPKDDFTRKIKKFMSFFLFNVMKSAKDFSIKIFYKTFVNIYKKKQN